MFSIMGVYFRYNNYDDVYYVVHVTQIAHALVVRGTLLRWFR